MTFCMLVMHARRMKTIINKLTNKQIINKIICMKFGFIQQQKKNKPQNATNNLLKELVRTNFIPSSKIVDVVAIIIIIIIVIIIISLYLHVCLSAIRIVYGLWLKMHINIRCGYKSNVCVVAIHFCVFVCAYIFINPQTLTEFRPFNHLI